MSEDQQQRVGTETGSPRKIFLQAESLQWDKEDVSRSVQSPVWLCMHAEQPCRTEVRAQQSGGRVELGWIQWEIKHITALQRLETNSRKSNSHGKSVV